MFDDDTTRLCRQAAADGFFKALKDLFQQMDDAYEKAASDYGFVCSGCDENCCLTRFHHHTHLEYLYLRSGFDGLEKSRQERLVERAVAYDEAMAAAEKQNASFRHMCPVNEDGLCRLYAHRPMICRLHGVPHEINPPGRGRIFSAGCAEFDRRCGDRPYHPFDRTPFYVKMSDLELALKQRLGINRKFKRTVAQMLIPSGDPYK